VKAIFKLFFKLMLLATLTYGLMMLLIKLLLGQMLKPMMLLFEIGLFGLTFSLIMTIIQVQMVKAKGVKKINDVSLSASQKALFLSDMNKQQFLIMLRTHRRVRSWGINDEGRSLRLKSSPSLATWGEKISIDIRSVSDGKYEYQVISRPRFKLMIIDFAQNLENVKVIESMLR
jgi:hypothetical protein